MPLDRIPVGEGAEVVFIENGRFNTSLISFNFYLPIDKERIADFALLPFILTSCSKNYPDFSGLNYTLSKLYGANLFSSSEKVGDYQLLKVGISVIDDRFALDGESISDEATKLLFDLLFNPKAENGEFCKEDTEREKRRAIEHIKGEMSEKRIYAKQRLIEEMFKGEAYGIPKCGTEEQVEAITGTSLFKAWQDMLKTAFIRVNIVSKKKPTAVIERIIETFAQIERDVICGKMKSTPSPKTKEAKTVTEYMDVNQGKLCMGFSSDLCGGDEQAAALTVMCDVFGGGPYSRIFSIVREKLSLCYYCSSAAIRSKGFLSVSSGIEAENAEKAKNAILDQLDIMKFGKFSDSEFEASKKSIINSLATYNDSQGTLDTWYSLKIENDAPYTPEEVSGFIAAVTREDVEKTARGISLNTVYKLLPKGAAK